MRHGFACVIAAAVFVAAPIAAAAQALPRTSDGRPNLQGIGFDRQNRRELP